MGNEKRHVNNVIAGLAIIEDKSKEMFEAGFNRACIIIMQSLIKQFDDVEKKYDDITALHCRGEIAGTIALMGDIVSKGPYDENSVLV
jgi:hypothetical protein